jgi:hypothetical protein
VKVRLSLWTIEEQLKNGKVLLCDGYNNWIPSARIKFFVATSDFLIEAIYLPDPSAYISTFNS